MPFFQLSFIRADRDNDPTVMEALFLTVDRPFLPREGEGVEILEDYEAQTVDSVGYGADGSVLVHLGRVVLDDLQVKQLRKMGWRADALSRLPVASLPLPRPRSFLPPTERPDVVGAETDAPCQAWGLKRHPAAAPPRQPRLPE